MNNKRRQRIRSVISDLEQYGDLIDDLLSEEQDALDNMPENLEGSDSYERIETAASNLESAGESLEEAINYLEEASA